MLQLAHNQPQRHIYLDQPDVTEHQTMVLAATRLGAASLAVAVAENIHRAAAGGEPADRGHLHFDGFDPWPVRNIVKSNGKTWLHVDAVQAEPPLPGDAIIARIDPVFRAAKSRLHTLEHITVATALRKIQSLTVTKTQIADDALSAHISVTASQPLDVSQVFEIDSAVRSSVLGGHAVSYAKARNIEEARKTYGSLFRVNDRYTFSGKVRLVIIDGIDVNPCSGTHHSSSDVGPYSMTPLWQGGDGHQLDLVLKLTPTWMYWFGN